MDQTPQNTASQGSKSAPVASTLTPSNRKVLAIGGLVILVLIFAGAGYTILNLNDKPANSNNSNNVAINETPQTEVTLEPVATIPAGQTNPNIVGFGQTFPCAPRSDEEFYRTDGTFSIDPKNPNVMYVNAEYKGFHKSTDGGKTWNLLTNGIQAYGSDTDPNKPCYSEYPFSIIDPTNSNRVILAVSGAGGTIKDRNALSAGIRISEDAGASFTQMINDTMNGYVSSITIDPTDPNTVYYGTNSAPPSYLEADKSKSFVTVGLIYKTTNNGKTWKELPTGVKKNTGATNVYVNPANSKEILATTYTAPPPTGGSGGRNTTGIEQMGLLWSLDAGETWTISKPLPEDYLAILMSANSPKNFNKFFVSPQSGADATPKSFYSTDGGKTFTASNKYIDFAKYDPNDATGSRLIGYVWQSVNGPAVNKLLESSDSGKTWHEFSNLPAEIKNIGDKKTKISNIVWHPTEPKTFFLTGAGMHVWKTKDNGKTWTKLLDYTMV